MTEKLTEKEFVLRAIERLRTKNEDGTPKFRGIHVVYSSFNNAFREYFNSDPVSWIKKLEYEGVIVSKPVRGGVMIYKADEAPADISIGTVVDRIVRDEA